MQASESLAPGLCLLVQHSQICSVSRVLWQHQPTIHIQLLKNWQIRATLLALLAQQACLISHR